MPRYWNFKLHDLVIVNEKAKQSNPNAVGKKGRIIELLEGVIYDYYVQLEDGSKSKFKENELNLYKGDGCMFKNNEKVIYKPSGEEARVNGYDLYNKKVGLSFDDGSYKVVSFESVEKINLDQIENLSKNKFQEGDEVEIISDEDDVVSLKGKKGKVVYAGKKWNKYHVQIDEDVKIFEEYELKLVKRNKVENSNEIGKFQRIANEIGAFTDDKNKQYGSSVDATYEMMKVLMERYTYDEENYLIPKDLIKHMLLTVRMMDKMNRLFNNPSGKGDSESPWNDITGYGLIGVDMVNRKEEC